MPKKFDRPTSFAMTALDKAILENCEYDLNLWMAGYFDGQAFPWQSYFYHAPQKDKCLVASIRVGKSRLVAMGFLHFAQYHPYCQLLNTSISSEQSKIVYRTCLELCSMPRFAHWVEHVQSSPFPVIRLVNGAELHFRSIGYDAELIRGFEFDWINVDEAGYVTREQAITTLRGRLLGFNNRTHLPRLGHFSTTSSPKGQGWLAERWKKGDPQFSGAEPHKYLSLRATIWDNPTLSREDIERQMAEYTDAMIAQEFYGEFTLNYDAMFAYQNVMDCCSAEKHERELRGLYQHIQEWKDAHERRVSLRGESAGLTDDIEHYECPPQPGHRYVNSWDFGKKPTAKGRNAMVGVVYDITHEPWVQVAFFYREGMAYTAAKEMVEQWHAKYSLEGAAWCRTAIDATGKGDVIQEFMEAEKTIDKLEGIVYSGVNKPNLLHAGKLMVERGLVVFPFIRRQVDQLTNYEIFDKEIAQDIVMAFCQAMYVARDLTRMTERPGLQRTLGGMAQYSSRTMQARLMNPRYVERRMAARAARQLSRNTRHR